MTERLVTACELGDLLGLKAGTVLDYWEAGKLPGYKIGRAVRFDPDEILAMTRRDPTAIRENDPQCHLAALPTRAYCPPRRGAGQGQVLAILRPRRFLTPATPVHRIVSPCLRAAHEQTESLPHRACLTPLHGPFVPRGIAGETGALM